MRSAGGLIGFFASAPLVAALTPWVAAPLLTLVCGFGLLVITRTPLHRVPDRVAELRGLTRRTEQQAPGEAETKEGAAGAGRRGRKRSDLEPGDHTRPYATPLLPEDGGKRGRKGGKETPALPGGAEGGAKPVAGLGPGGVPAEAADEASLLDVL